MKKKILIAIILLIISLNALYIYKTSKAVDYTFSNMYKDDIDLSDSEDYVIDKKVTQIINSTNNNLYRVRLYLDPIDNKYDGYDFITVNYDIELTDMKGNRIDKYKFKKIFFENGPAVVDFKFPAIENSEGKKYLLNITTYTTDNAVSIKLGENKDLDNSKMFIDGEETNKSLLYETSYYYNANNTFIKIFSIIIIVFGILLIIFNHPKIKNIGIEKKYLIIALIVSIFCISLTPLFFGMDEQAHWARIYEISEGDFITGEIDGWPKSKLPNKIFEISFSTYNMAKYKFNQNYTNNDVIMNMDCMAVYSPISYIPHVMGTLFAKLVTSHIFLWPYISRVFSAIFCIACVCFAIKIIPFAKKTLFLIGVLPSTIKTFSLLSADGTLIATSLLFIAKILQIVYDKKSVNKIDYLLLGILAVVISLSKLVYFPICLLLILIPFKLKDKRKNKIIGVVTIISVALLITFLWNVVAVSKLIGGQGVNVTYYIMYYLKNPIELFQILFYTTYNNLGRFVNDTFGGTNEWYGTLIKDASVFPVIFFVMYLAISIREKCDFNKKDKYLISGIIILVYLLIAGTLLVTCTSVHSREIIIIQGRYLIPLLLPISLLIGNNKNRELSIDLSNWILLIYIAYYLEYMVYYL